MILLPEVTYTMSMTPPAVAPDTATRLLVIPYKAFGPDATAPLPISAGLPAGSVEIASAKLIMGATSCDAPMFLSTIEKVARGRERDVLLVRAGLFPETLNPVVSDVALFAKDIVMLRSLSFYRHRDNTLWLLPADRGPCLAVEPGGLRLEMLAPYMTGDERSDGLIRAAGEIVRVASNGRIR